MPKTSGCRRATNAAAKPPRDLNPELLARNARRFVRKNTSDFFVHPQLGDFLRGELDVYLKHEFVQVWDAADAELSRIRAQLLLPRWHGCIVGNPAMDGANAALQKIRRTLIGRKLEIAKQPIARLALHRRLPELFKRENFHATLELHARRQS